MEEGKEDERVEDLKKGKVKGLDDGRLKGQKGERAKGRKGGRLTYEIIHLLDWETGSSKRAKERKGERRKGGKEGRQMEERKKGMHLPYLRIYV